MKLGCFIFRRLDSIILKQQFVSVITPCYKYYVATTRYWWCVYYGVSKSNIVNKFKLREYPIFPYSHRLYAFNSCIRHGLSFRKNLETVQIYLEPKRRDIGSIYLVFSVIV